MLHRRSAIYGMAAAVAFPKTLRARSFGNAKLSTVSDGSLILPRSFAFGGLPQIEVSKVLQRFSLDTQELKPECNLALFQDGTNVVLFDAGSGPDFMPSAGRILDNLDETGLSVGDVTHVVFTHAHPDHIWGLIDEFDELTFPNATYYMGRKEWDYWWNPETVEIIGDARAAFAVGAKRRMSFIEDQTVLFDDGDEIIAGISATATFGHTPGHMSFEVRSGSESAMIVGDAIGNHHVAFAQPKWESGADQDPTAAIEARELLLDRLTNEKMLTVGFHLPNGGVGYVERAEIGYQFVSEEL